MREILQTLNQNADVLGSMVITPDGIMVAAALNSDLEEDKVAGFCVFVPGQFEAEFEPNEQRRRHFVLHAQVDRRKTNVLRS